MRPFGVEEESTTEVQLGDGEPPTPPDQAAPLPPRPASPAAQAAGVSESELAREAIDDYLAKESEPALRHVPHRQCTLCISVGVGPSRSRWVHLDCGLMSDEAVGVVGVAEESGS